jgi:hypothetical protein
LSSCKSRRPTGFRRPSTRRHEPNRVPHFRNPAFDGTQLIDGAQLMPRKAVSRIGLGRLAPFAWPAIKSNSGDPCDRTLFARFMVPWPRSNISCYRPPFGCARKEDHGRSGISC